MLALWCCGVQRSSMLPIRALEWRSLMAKCLMFCSFNFCGWERIQDWACCWV